MTSNNETSVFVPRADMLAVQTFGKVVSTFGTILVCFLLIIELTTIYTRRKSLFKTSVNNRKALYPALSLLSVAVMGLFVMINGLVLWWPNWIGSEPLCEVYSKLTICVYVFFKQMTYVLFFERLKVVHTALVLNHWMIRALRWLTFLSSTIGFSTIAFPLISIFFHGVVTPEGTCIQIAESPYFVLLMAVLDTLLNLMLLILFILPVSRHVQAVDSTTQSSQHPLKRLARKNLRLSIAMMSCTLTMLFFMLQSLLQLDYEHDVNLSVGSMQLLHTILGAVDTICSVILCHVISTSWIPKQVKLYLEKHFAKTHSSTGGPDKPSKSTTDNTRMIVPVVTMTNTVDLSNDKTRESARYQLSNHGDFFYDKSPESIGVLIHMSTSAEISPDQESPRL